MIIGSSDMAVFGHPDHTQQLHANIQDALSQGVPPETPVPLSLGVICNLLVRLEMLEREVYGRAAQEQTEAEVAEDEQEPAEAEVRVGRVVLPGGDDAQE